MSVSTRLIIICNENGDKEDVIFTEDLGCPASDWCCPDQTVSFDGVVDVDLPCQFPMESSLRNMR